MATYSKGANGAFPGKVGSGPQLAQHRLPESSAKRLDKINVASSNGITTYDTASFDRLYISFLNDFKENLKFWVEVKINRI
ncbi:hypothetical protein ASU31_20115 [Pedobacter ginsenosidimutans]|uniref:Uncharacterized protein n=1 Tax=Pedobacter ginsenosidimutans TaxID=687842 RepID=A0A0T5VKD6_9SPHI|nr:hypothetical protein [Pedobacter ginsenosidimutans]KRT14318.1 hypothetical protein ASU31_20115 [Pedobacter ginsenosidimutans]